MERKVNERTTLREHLERLEMASTKCGATSFASFSLPCRRSQLGSMRSADLMADSPEKPYKGQGLARLEPQCGTDLWCRDQKMSLAPKLELGARQLFQEACGLAVSVLSRAVPRIAVTAQLGSVLGAGLVKLSSENHRTGCDMMLSCLQGQISFIHCHY